LARELVSATAKIAKALMQPEASRGDQQRLNAVAGIERWQVALLFPC